MSKFAFILILFFYPSVFVVAQLEPTRNFSVKEGLPSGVVYDCLQDNQRFMWFATAAGLARFDGANFKVFTKEDGLTNNEVLQLALDKDGSIWIFPFHTTPCIYDPATQMLYNQENYAELRKLKDQKTITVVRTSTLGPLCRTMETAFYVQNKKVFPVDLKGAGDIWPLNRDSIILFYTNKESYLFTNTGKSKLNLVVPATNIHESKSPDWGRWKIFINAAMTTQLSLFEYVNNDLIKERGVFKSHYVINSVTRHRQKIYLPTVNGVYITDTMLSPLDYFFPGKNISKVFIDKNGNEWLCSLSGDGVYLRLKNNVRQFNTNTGLPVNNVTALKVDQNNSLICGDGDGNIFSIDPAEKIIRPFFHTKLSSTARGIELHSNSFLAYSSYRLYVHNNFSLRNIRSVIKSVIARSKDELIIGTHEFLFRYDSKELIFDTISGIVRFTTLAYLGDKLYFGNTQGLFEVDSTQYRKRKPPNTENAVLQNPINHLVPTNDDILWIATNTDGVFAYKNEKIIAHFNTLSSQPLTSNICKKIFFDKEEGAIWIATNKGLNRIRYKLSADSLSAIVNSVTSSEGLNDDDVNDVCVRNGKVYAATIKGICVFDAELLRETIPVRITDVFIKDYSLTDTSSAERTIYNLTHKQNNISVSYTGICFTCDKKLLYHYRMIGAGHDTSWNTTTANTVEFGELRKGNYTFQVRTDRGDMQELTFNIKPAFWQTNWFYALVVLSILGIFFFSLKFIARQIRKRELEKTATNKKFAELEFQALQAQMNPHFVFNAMSTLQYYILKNESENASEYLAKFARLMRLFLESSRNKFTELRNEIELLRNYIELEQARLDDKFQYRIKIDPQVEMDTKIPSVMIQPFVENAILHGLRHKNDGSGLLDLQFSARDHTLECRIQDNGIGREASAMINKAKDKLYKSQALNIIDDKVKALKEINNVEIRISIEDNSKEQGQGTGTTVTILFGLNN